MIVVPAQAVVERERVGGVPVILHPGRGANFGEAGIGLAEALEVEIRTGGGEGSEGGKDIETLRGVGREGAQGDVIDARAELEEMGKMLEREAVGKFSMRLEVTVIAEGGRAEEGDAGNESAGNEGIGGGRVGAARGEAALGQLEVELVEARRAERGGERGVEAVVGDEGGAARGEIGQIVGVEGVGDVARVGEGIAQHEGVTRREGVVETGGKLGLLIGGGEESGMKLERTEDG